MIEMLDANKTSMVLLYIYELRDTELFKQLVQRFVSKIEHDCKMKDISPDMNATDFNDLNILGIYLINSFSQEIAIEIINKTPVDKLQNILYRGFNTLECAIKYYRLPNKIINHLMEKGVRTNQFSYCLIQNSTATLDIIKLALKKDYISLKDRIHIIKKSGKHIQPGKYSLMQFMLCYVADISPTYHLKKRNGEVILKYFIQLASIEDLLSPVEDGYYQNKNLLQMATLFHEQEMVDAIKKAVKTLNPSNAEDEAEVAIIEGYDENQNFFDMVDAIAINSEDKQENGQILHFNEDEWAILQGVLSDEPVEYLSGQATIEPLNVAPKNDKPIKMFIDQKYLDFNYPEEQQLTPSRFSGKHSTHAFEQLTVTKLAFQTIGQFPVDGQYQIISHQTPNYNYVYSETKAPISPFDQVFVVFAGRGLNASLPRDIGLTRCLVVLTAQEFEACAISKRSMLLEKFDFLILTKPRIKGDGTTANIATLIERRRAALDFSNLQRLENVVFMDDNVEEIGFVAPLGFENSFAGLFSYAVHQMHSKQNLLVSIHTYSNLKRVPLERMLGCKVWALDLKEMRKYLPGDALQLCFPDKEDAWGEDYFLQILLDVLTPASEGFRILNHEVVELVRRKSHTSACAKTGVRAKPFTIDDIIPKGMIVTPAIRGKIIEAIDSFNQLLEQQMNHHLEAARAVQENNYENQRASQHPIYINPKMKLNAGLFFEHKQFRPKNLELKEYQKSAIGFYLKDKEQKNITYNMPTGSGKTLIMLTIAFANFARYKKNIIMIFPRIELIKQLLNEIQGSRYSILLDYFQIRFEQIFGVSSGEISQLNNAMLSQEIVAYNKGMQETPHILIYCEDSWKNYLENSVNSNLLKSLGLIIFDESHLQTATIQKTRKSFPDISMHYYSATPNTIKDETFFNYSREEAIRQGHLAPIYVDSTLPNQVDTKTLLKIILDQVHPNGLPLFQHKGIIFVDRIEDAQELAITLKAALGAEYVFEVHSKCKDFSENIQKFRKKDMRAIAIAVDMLQEGYNDETLDFLIYAKNTKVTESLKQNLIQAAGRLHRKSLSKPDKIGFLIVNSIYFGIVTTCLPRMMKFIPSVQEGLGYNFLETNSKRELENNSINIMRNMRVVFDISKEIDSGLCSSYFQNR